MVLQQRHEQDARGLVQPAVPRLQQQAPGGGCHFRGRRDFGADQVDVRPGKERHEECRLRNGVRQRDILLRKRQELLELRKRPGRKNHHTADKPAEAPDRAPAGNVLRGIFLREPEDL